MGKSEKFEQVLTVVDEAVTASEVTLAEAEVSRYLEAYPEDVSHEAWTILLHKKDEAGLRQEQARALGLSERQSAERENLVRRFVHLLRRDAGNPTFLERLSEMRRAILSWQEQFPADDLPQEMQTTLLAREREALLLMQIQSYLAGSDPAGVPVADTTSDVPGLVKAALAKAGV